MPRPTKFAPKQTPKGWMLNIPGKYTATGARERRYFPSRSKALDAAAILKAAKHDHGANAAAISPLIASQAVEALKILAPFSIGLVEAATIVAGMESANRASRGIEAAMEAFLAKRGEKSDANRRATGYMARDLMAAFPGRILASITGEELADHVKASTNGPASHNSRRALLSAFWRWCARKPRQWCDPLALQHIEISEECAGEIMVLTATQAEALLRTAERHFPDAVPALAILIFPGIRKQELERLAPENLTPEGLTVPAAASKTNRRRFIQMSDPLAAWLERYPVGETVIPANWKRKDRAIRRLAGWKVWTDLVKPDDDFDSLPEWPDNAIRHTAASMALALGKPIETLVFEHGHAGNLAVLKNHYIGRMPRAEAEAIWALRPK